MTKRKQILIYYTIAIPLIIFGFRNFEYQGIDSIGSAIAVAASLSFGILAVVYGTYIGFFSKETTTNKGEKPVAKKKQKIMKDEQDAVLISDLISREKELLAERKDSQSRLEAIDKEEGAIQKRLIEEVARKKEEVEELEKFINIEEEC